MPYSGLQNCGGSSNDQNAQDADHAARLSGNSTSIDASTTEYKTSSTQPQYNPSACNLSGQSQQSYGTGNGEIQSYGNSGWRGINGQQSRQPVYDFERQRSSHDIPISTADAGQNLYISAGEAVTQQSMQGLNNLAYASGLGLAGRQEGSHAIRAGKSDPTAFNAHRNTGVAKAGVSSPAQAAPQNSSNQKPASTSSSHAHSESGSSKQDLAASAAAALAGAVSRRKGNQQPPALAHHQPSSPTPSMGNASSRDGCNPQPSYMTASPYVVSTGNPSRVTQQSAQHNRPPSSRYVSPQTQRYANASGPNPSKIRTTTKPQVHGRINDQAQRPNRSCVPNITAQNYNRIANPVTNTGPQESLLPNPQQPPTPLDVMPSCIDPSQAFNPYHKEYEQKKRQAAEAEAEVHRKVAEKSPEKPVTRSQIVVPTESTVPEAPRKTAKRKEEKSGPVPPMTSSPQTSTTSQTTLDTEVDMASEMKAMIERMREWKKKDPSMFQKLWEDLKKGDAASSAPPGSTASSPQIGKATLPKNRSGNTSEVASVSNVLAACNAQGPGLPAEMNGYKVIVEDNDEGLPDLGRFPAERRYWQSYTEKDANVSNERDDGPSKLPVDPSLVQKPATGPQSTPQPLPARTSCGNTIWPEEKRKALADAAVKALHAEPVNRDKGITTQTIRDILKQNPSYIDLCKLLEGRGLKLHRGHFARQLLSNVPDLATVQSKAGAEPPSKPVRPDMGPSQTRPALTQAIPVPPATGRPQLCMNGSHPGPRKVEMPAQTTTLSSRFLNQTANSHTPQPLSNTKPDDTSMSRAVKAHLGVASSNLPPPIPGSKNALSRKRDFIDLTQLSDDEDYVIPSKQPRLEESSPEPEKIDADVVVHGQTSTSQPSQGRPTFAQSLQFSPHQPQPALATALQPTQRPRAILARPINKSEALRKSYYDPKTVARDILIAAGRHPSERPLNAHLAGLLHRHIELDSDLSTFDWDAVDPGGPPMPRVQMVDIPAGPPKWKLGAQRRGPRNTYQDEPIRERFSYQPNAKADRMPALNSLARLSAQTKHLLQDSQKAANPSRLCHSHLAHDTSQDGIGAAVTPQKRKASSAQSRTRSSRSTSLREPKSLEREHNMENPSIRRRGRPPGAKNKHPSLTAMKKAANTSPLVSMPSRPRSPPPAPFDVYECQWRKCNAKLHNLATLRRHISKVHRPSTEEVIKFGHTCWWKKCRTLLRNEDRTVTPKERFQSHSEWMEHIDEDHLHRLGMEKGDGPSTAHIGKPQIKPFDMNKYIYRPHPKSCDPLARTVSYLDPQSIAADRATYLSDEHGRAVTAPATKATNNVYAPDALILAPVSKGTEERVPIKQYMRAHGNEKMDLKTSASETLRAMEVKKERLGPGMDRGGCTLVNKERRATLLQNEGIARVVNDDD